MNYYIYPGLKVPPPVKRVSIDTLARLTTEFFGLSLISFRGKSRTIYLVTARFFLMEFAYRHAGFILTEIGSYLNRDHTTVLNGLTTFKNRSATEYEYREQWNTYYRFIQANK
jgi:chromosomal replication initiation ATPase DnaA